MNPTTLHMCGTLTSVVSCNRYVFHTILCNGVFRTRYLQRPSHVQHVLVYQTHNSGLPWYTVARFVVNMSAGPGKRLTYSTSDAVHLVCMTHSVQLYVQLYYTIYQIMYMTGCDKPQHRC